MMKYRFIILIPAILLASSLQGAQADSAMEAPVHEDWFEVKYDEVRDLTLFKTKDDFGPGNAIIVDEAPLKISLTAAVSGKVYDPAKPVAVKIIFNRSAGLKNLNSPTDADSDYKPFKEHQLHALDICKDLVLLLPTGKRVSLTAPDNSYRTAKSGGLMGEVYLWEIRGFSTNLGLLWALSNGAKAALCDLTFEMNRDQISEVRTLVAMIRGLGTNIQAAPAMPAASNASAPFTPPMPSAGSGPPPLPALPAPSLSEKHWVIQLKGGALVPLSSNMAGLYGIGFDGGVLVGKAITKNFTLGLEASYGELPTGTAYSFGYILGSYTHQTLLAVPQVYLGSEKKVRPYLFAGVGVAFDSFNGLGFGSGYGSVDFELEPGFGLSFDLEDTFGLFIQTKLAMDFSGYSYFTTDSPAITIPVEAGIHFVP